MSRHTWLLILALVLLPAMVSQANAQEEHWQTPSYAPGVYTHDGFGLRMQLGFGYAEAGTDDDESGKLTFSGGGMKFQIDIGGAVSENLLLYGTLGFLSISDPEIETDEGSFEGTGATFSINQYGIGLDYYLMPANVYIGGALLAVKDHLKIETIFGDLDYSTDTGVGLQLHVGKEWWVSDNWGLGVSGFLMFASVPSEGESLDGTKNDVTFGNFALGLNFSATYN